MLELSSLIGRALCLKQYQEVFTQAVSVLASSRAIWSHSRWGEEEKYTKTVRLGNLFQPLGIIFMPFQRAGELA